MRPARADAAPGPRQHRAWTPLARALVATGDHWTLMIVLGLAPGRTRLAVLQRRLPGVSTGVLERYVQQMVALGLVTRDRYKEMPPRVELELTGAGRELVPIAEALSRWGMRRRWSEPQEGERVDIDALLRVLPALLVEQPGLPDGFLEARIVDADPPVSRTYHLRAGVLRLVEGAGTNDGAAADAGQPSTRVSGETPAWIRALGPARNAAQLEIAGDEQLAKRILDALPLPAQPIRAQTA